MPSVSAKQARTMAACAHGAKLDVCKKIPRKVAKEFNRADEVAHIGHLRKAGWYKDK